MLMPAIILNSSPATVLHRANAARAHVDLGRIGLGVGDERRNGRSRQCRIDRHDRGIDRQAGDRRDVAEKHEIEVIVESRIDGIRRYRHQQRMAVRGRV